MVQRMFSWLAGLGLVLVFLVAVSPDLSTPPDVQLTRTILQARRSVSLARRQRGMVGRLLNWLRYTTLMPS